MFIKSKSKVKKNFNRPNFQLLKELIGPEALNDKIKVRSTNKRYTISLPNQEIPGQRNIFFSIRYENKTEREKKKIGDKVNFSFVIYEFFPSP